MANFTTDQTTPAEAAIATLKKLPDNHKKLDEAELTLIDLAMNNGETWDTLAEALGKESGQSMYERYTLLGGRRPFTPVHQGPGGPKWLTAESAGRTNSDVAELEARVTEFWNTSRPTK